MVVILFVVVLFVLLASRIHIAVGLGMTGIILLLIYHGIPLQVINQSVFKSVDSYPLAAIPFFILLGEGIQKGKLAPYVMELINVFLRRFRGGLAVAVILTNFLYLSGRILLGLVIFALGLFLARVVGEAIASRQKTHGQVWVLAARTAILFLAGAMALRQMGLADEVISLAFGLTFGAVTVATAIAFGVGGRNLAGRKLEEWEESLRKRQDIQK